MSALRRCVVGVGLALSCAMEANAQCLIVVDDKAAPAVTAPEVDVKQILRLTDAGADALAKVQAGKRPIAYVEVTREAGAEDVGGKRVTRPSETFVRMLDAPQRGNARWLETPFTFSRAGDHTLRLFAATEYVWPAPADPAHQGIPIADCAPLTVPVKPPPQDRIPPEERRKDFTGVRGQWWGTYRIPARFDVGGAVFVERIGFAASTELSVPRTIGDRNDPGNLNAVTHAFDVRWRGARGYIGGGVRYYPDEEPDRDQLRFGVVAGEELPSFHGRPFWLLVELSLEERRRNFLKGLRPAFGVRFDLWGSQP